MPRDAMMRRMPGAMERERGRLLALHQASTVLAGLTDPQAILAGILRSAVQLTGHGGASLFIWVAEAKILRNVRDHEVPPGVTARTVRSGEGVAGMAFQTREPFIVNDYQTWAGATKAARDGGQQAAVGVPLLRQGEPIGSLIVRSYDPTAEFSDEDGRLLALFADQAVAALTAAQAFEQQRAAVGDLERLSKAKSDFISIVSHEFRTPLTGIQGFSELIRDEDLPMEEIREYAANINKDAQRLNRMITDLLDLDRMESGRMQIHPSAVDLNALLAEVAERTQPTAALHPMRLDLDPALPKLWADRDRIVQVVTNLIANAVKYSPDGGEIAIGTRLDKSVEPAQAEVSIRDHGIGIPEDALEKVFERYWRVESPTTRYIQGTGLGLPIVRQIVDLHGGRVWVTSELGKGSDFRFSLPATKAD